LFNYKVVFGYSGTYFSGSQFQPKQRTVEGELLKALQRIYKKRVPVQLAGRTDAGVHAEGQVFNYITEKSIKASILKKALSGHLPEDIWIQEIKEINLAFNARKDAFSREYQYLFSEQDIPYHLRDFIVQIRRIKNVHFLVELPKILVGTHNFKNFMNTGSTFKTTNKTIYKVSIQKKEVKTFFNLKKVFVYYKFSICGDGFLYRMVRNLVGGLFEMLRAKLTLSDFMALLDKNERFCMYTTAPAKGLCLFKINYQE